MSTTQHEAFLQWRESVEGWTANGDGMQRLAFMAGWRIAETRRDAESTPTREASAGERWARNAREIADALRDGHPAVDPAWIATILEECATLVDSTR